LGSSTKTAADIVNENMTEDDWITTVYQYAKARAWLFSHFRPARVNVGGVESYRTAILGDKGFPDAVMTRGRRTYVAEFKSQKGTVSSEQMSWIKGLRASGITVYVWRPSDWPEVERLLK
jgi:hypothetical protein